MLLFVALAFLAAAAYVVSEIVTLVNPPVKIKVGIRAGFPGNGVLGLISGEFARAASPTGLLNMPP